MRPDEKNGDPVSSSYTKNSQQVRGQGLKTEADAGLFKPAFFPMATRVVAVSAKRLVVHMKPMCLPSLMASRAQTLLSEGLLLLVLLPFLH